MMDSSSATTTQGANAVSSSMTTPTHSQQPASSATSGGPQIRSRITVVCAECKRLKLKCDRRNPCGSCVKRDTVPRCIYSPAAAEKVDLHSLNNRLISVESQLALLSQCPLSSNPSLPSSSSLHSISTNSSLFGRGPAAVSNSSLNVSIEDLDAIWLEDLGVGLNPGINLTESSFAYTPVRKDIPRIKTESSEFTHTLPPPSPALHTMLPSITSYYALSPSSSASLPASPTVTPELIKEFFPAQAATPALYDTIGQVLRMHPMLNWNWLCGRFESVHAWAANPGLLSKKQDTARSIFFEQSAPVNKGPFTNVPLGTPAGKAPEHREVPTLSFFAAMAAAFSLGALVSEGSSTAAPPSYIDLVNPEEDCLLADGGSISRRRSDGSVKRTRAGSIGAQSRISAGTSQKATRNRETRQKEPNARSLLALSRQALDLAESEINTNTNSTGENVGYNLDWVIALLLQLICTVYGGTGVGNKEGMFVLVGKLVNTARLLSLHIDPEDLAPKLWGGGVFEAEMRRRLWWAVVWWDLFVSDALNQAPIIQEGLYTVKLPAADLDEDALGPNCVNLPRLSQDERGNCFPYSNLRSRLTQLVQRVKKRTCRDSFSMDDAVSIEGEITQWLADLPVAYRVPLNDDVNSRTDHLFLVAQRSELTITVHRLILKVYLPFLLHRDGPSSPHQATGGTVNAAHNVIHVSRLLHTSHTHVFQHPSGIGFDSFGKSLFDAAVVSALAVMRQPGTVWAKTALEDVRIAADTIRGFMGDGGEVVRTLDLMADKAETARGAGVNSGLGVKRKREESSEVNPVVNVGPNSLHPPVPAPATPSVVPKADSVGRVRTTTTLKPPSIGQVKPDSFDAKGSKKVSYPPVGIRVRPGKDNLRQRTESASTASCGNSPIARFNPSSFSGPRTPIQDANTNPPAAPPSMSRQPSFDHTSHKASSPDTKRPLTQEGRVQQTHHRGSMPQDIPISAINTDYSIPFGEAHMSAVKQQQFSVRDLGQEHQGYPAASISTPSSMYDSHAVGAYSTAASPSYGASNGSGPVSDSSSPYDGRNSVTPFGPPPSQRQQQPTASSTYRPTPPTNQVPSFYVQEGYATSYDHGGMQNNIGLGINPPMNHQHSSMAMAPPQNSSHNAMYSLPLDKDMYDIKPLEVLQPPFGGGPMQQNWTHDGGSGGSSYWSTSTAPYYS